MKLKYLQSTLLFYSQIFLLFFLTVSLATSDGRAQLGPILLLLPVVIYYSGATLNYFLHLDQTHLQHTLVIARALRIYSTLITFLLFFSSFLLASNFPELTFSLLFAPLCAYFGLLTYRERQGRKIQWSKLSWPRLPLKKISALRKVERKVDESPPVTKDLASATKVVSSLPVVDENSALDTEVVGEEMSEADYELRHQAQTTSPADNDDDNKDETEKITFAGIKDLDRRQFLKLLGTGSLGVIAMTLFFPQKAGAAFFGSVPGPGTVALKNTSGNQIDPKEKSPTDGYTISEIDDAALPSYYGFVNKDGAWYISKEGSDGSYRYSKGGSSFSTNWTNRASLTYDLFDVIF